MMSTATTTAHHARTPVAEARELATRSTMTPSRAATEAWESMSPTWTASETWGTKAWPTGTARSAVAKEHEIGARMTALAITAGARYVALARTVASLGRHRPVMPLPVGVFVLRWGSGTRGMMPATGAIVAVLVGIGAVVALPLPRLVGAVSSLFAVAPLAVLIFSVSALSVLAFAIFALTIAALVGISIRGVVAGLGGTVGL